MSVISRPPLPSDSTASRAARPPRWGYLSRSVSHYGTVACVLAVYPPDSTDEELRLAQAHRWYTPLSLGGGVVAWVVLCAVGISPLLAAALLLAALLPIGIALSRRSRDIRHRTVTISACRAGLGEDTEAERAQQLRLDSLAEALGDAALACRQGVIDRDRFDRIWAAAYAQAAAIAATSAR
ncbi:DUF6611 family protein [Microbacterium maritypicum]|uniref:DUF6611 family protein n=1 Tax=Microbacterium maritypicum TaxID=33918 RepID=UPI003A937FB4